VTSGIKKSSLTHGAMPQGGYPLEIQAAQKEVRTVFNGGFIGQLISSLLWFISAAFLTWRSEKVGITILVLGGFLIFPMLQLVLRLMKRPYKLCSQNPMGQLAMQLAFTLPISLLLVAGASLHRHDWFYPAFMIALGAHYLPFTFLYGMRMFISLCALLVGAGFTIGIYFPGMAQLAPWLTGIILLVFAFAGWSLVAHEQKHSV
jgi:hypothetical protein